MLALAKPATLALSAQSFVSQYATVSVAPVSKGVVVLSPNPTPPTLPDPKPIELRSANAGPIANSNVGSCSAADVSS